MHHFSSPQAVNSKAGAYEYNMPMDVHKGKRRGRKHSPPCASTNRGEVQSSNALRGKTVHFRTKVTQLDSEYSIPVRAVRHSRLHRESERRLRCGIRLYTDVIQGGTSQLSSLGSARIRLHHLAIELDHLLPIYIYGPHTRRTSTKYEPKNRSRLCYSATANDQTDCRTGGIDGMKSNNTLNTLILR